MATTPHEASKHGPDPGLPVAALLALAMAGFINIMTETLPAGILPRIAPGLHVSAAAAGQLVTAYAAGTIAAAIPLVALTRGWHRRPLLLVTVVGFLLFNTLTAVSSSYPLTLFARFMAGVAAGVSWGILPGYARRMVHPRRHGRAIALAMVGTPIALAIGTPLGTFLAGLVGWRAVFLIISAAAIVLSGWIALAVPDFPGQSADGRSGLADVLQRPGVRPILIVVMGWMLAHNILYTYIAPFAQLSGLAGRVDVLLLVFGLAALAGIWFTGLLVDRWLRRLTLSSLALFAVVAMALALDAYSPLVVYAATVAWGLTFGGAATLLQTALSDAAGEDVDVAQAMMATSWNSAIAGGGLLGGLLLNTAGAARFGWVVFALTLGALAVAYRSDHHAFRPRH